MKFLIVLALVVVAVNAGSSQPEGCRKGLCRMYCEYGFARDANRCFQCKCNKDLTHCPIAPNCFMMCPTGYARGLDGCFDCKCNKDLSHCEGRPMCAMFCENGFQKGRDGCDICKCA